MKPKSLSRDQAAVQSARWIFAQAVDTLQRMGFPHCHYRISLPVPVSRPTIIDLDSGELDSTNYIRRERSDYDGNAVLSLDDILSRFNELADPAFSRRVGNETAQHSMRRDNITVISYHRNGAIGEMTLSPMLKFVGQPTLNASQPIVEWLATSVHERIATLLVATYVPESRVRLTSREREILQWTADGKTAPEIGQILSVSSNTVVFHLKNIVVKLSASNKIQAAVKATALGILR